LAEADIGIDNAHQRQTWEVMTLGDKLRADDNVDLAVGDGFQFGLQAFGAAHHVGGEHQRAGVGKRVATSSAMRSTPGPEGTSVSALPHSGQAWASARHGRNGGS
jgi:hypothetical protein